jgi:hypothetical protein
MTILVWLDRARGGSVHEVVGPSMRDRNKDTYVADTS